MACNYDIDYPDGATYGSSQTIEIKELSNAYLHIAISRFNLPINSTTIGGNLYKFSPKQGTIGKLKIPYPFVAHITVHQSGGAPVSLVIEMSHQNSQLTSGELDLQRTKYDNM